MLGNNMFAYCNNNPVCHADPTGEVLIEIILAAGEVVAILVCGVAIFYCSVMLLTEFFTWLSKQWYEPFATIKYTETEETVPDVTYPGDDPQEAPDGYEWKGKGEKGSKEGNYHNGETGESLHPDLEHPEPIGPHWDYNFRGSGCNGWRIFPDGSVVAKIIIGIIAVTWGE